MSCRKIREAEDTENKNNFRCSPHKPCWQRCPEEDPGSRGGSRGRGCPGEVVSGAVWQGRTAAHGSALTASLPTVVFTEPRSNYLKPQLSPKLFTEVIPGNVAYMERPLRPPSVASPLSPRPRALSIAERKEETRLLSLLLLLCSRCVCLRGLRLLSPFWQRSAMQPGRYLGSEEGILGSCSVVRKIMSVPCGAVSGDRSQMQSLLYGRLSFSEKTLSLPPKRLQKPSPDTAGHFGSNGERKGGKKAFPLSSPPLSLPPAGSLWGARGAMTGPLCTGRLRRPLSPSSC